jgi:hypothetical protein
MVRSMVGGREFDFTKEQIEKRMSREQPEPIREHFVEVRGRLFPPKQVIACMKPEWPRTSFTTMEAQRVLARLGLPSKRYAATETRLSLTGNQVPVTSEPEVESDARLERLEASLVVANEAIAGLAARVDRLESAIR